MADIMGTTSGSSGAGRTSNARSRICLWVGLSTGSWFYVGAILLFGIVVLFAGLSRSAAVLGVVAVLPLVGFGAALTAWGYHQASLRTPAFLSVDLDQLVLEWPSGSHRGTILGIDQVVDHYPRVISVGNRRLALVVYRPYTLRIRTQGPAPLHPWGWEDGTDAIYLARMNGDRMKRILNRRASIASDG